MKKILSSFLICLSASSYAQINNPGIPTNAVAGTGLNQVGSTLSVKYGTAAGTALQGNQIIATSQGGTGTVTNPPNAVLIGAGTGAVQSVLPGIQGTSLVSSGSASIPVYISPAANDGKSGNKLINFANKSLVNNGRKQIIVVGNSTVWGASGYYNEMCNAINSGILSNVGLTPCSQGISGYQVVGGSGQIQVTFTGSVPAGYSVGDIIISQATSGSLTALNGSGVITAIGSNTINYTLLAINSFPTAGAFVPSNGIISNSLLNFGYNGAPSTAIKNTVVPFLGSYAHAGDLVIVRGPLINDVRLGACNLACAFANIVALYNAINTVVPQATDIVWKTENSLLTTDPTSSGYVSPLASSAAYSAIIDNAVVSAIASLNSRAVLWDTQQIVYTKIGGERSTSNWMADILHPNSNGQIREAAADYQLINNFLHGYGFPASNLFDPYFTTANNTSLSSGVVEWFSTLRTKMGFSQYLSEHAASDNYSAPWALYPDSLLDTTAYIPVVYGTVLNAGSDYVRFGFPTVAGGNPVEVYAGDIIWTPGNAAYKISSFGQSEYNAGGTIHAYQLTSLAGLPTLTPGMSIAVMRQKTYNLGDIGYLYDTATYKFAKRITIVGAGANYLRVAYSDGTNGFPTAFTANDVITTTCGLIPLVGASFGQFASYVNINLTGSWAACAGATGIIYGTHAGAANFSVVGTSTLVDSNENLILTNATLPTISSAFSSGATISANNTAAFSVTATGATYSTGAISLPAAAHGWACGAQDVTNNATVNVGQYSSGTTFAGFAAYSRTTGLGVSFVPGDVLQFICFPY